MELKNDIDINEFSEIVYNISMNLKSGSEFKVRELFSIALWDSIKTTSKLLIGKKFDEIIKKENYKNIKKLSKDENEDNVTIYKKL